MNADLKTFALAWARIALMALVPVVLTTFVSMPQALGHHPGEPCVTTACAERAPERQTATTGLSRPISPQRCFSSPSGISAAPRMWPSTPVNSPASRTSMTRTRFATPTIGREWMVGADGGAIKVQAVPVSASELPPEVRESLRQALITAALPSPGGDEE